MLPIKSFIASLSVCVSCVALLLCSLTATAAPAPALTSVSHWAISQGMTSHAVSDLLQDQRGFLWIATRNGLQRFDGTQFDHFMAGQKEQFLPSNEIYDLWLAADQTLWVVTSRGLAYFRYDTGSFRRVHGEPNSWPDELPESSQIITNHDSQPILLMDGQLWQIQQQDNVVPLTLSYNEQAIEGIVNIHLGETWVWLAQADGNIYVWDGLSSDVFKLTKPNPITDPLPQTGFNHILPWQGKLWFAHDNGLFQLDQTLRLKQQLRSDTDLGALGDITRLAYVDDQHLILGSNQGIRLLDINNQGVAQQSRHGADQLPANLAVTAFTVDHLGRLWVGAENGGLYLLSKPVSELDFERLTDVTIDTELNSLALPQAITPYTAASRGFQGDWWFATSVGLVRYNAPNRLIKAVFPMPVSEATSVQQMMLFAEHLFVTTEQHGLFVFDLPNNQWDSVNSNHPLLNAPNLRLAKANDRVWVADDQMAVAINEFLQIDDERQLVSANSLQLLQPLHVEVSQQRHALTIDFVSPLAAQAEHVQYRYRLLNLEPEWQYTARPLQPITLQRLPADDYQLQVQASADGHDWSLHFQRDIRIAGTWWNSSLAWFCYLASALSVLVLFAVWLYKRARQLKHLQSQANQLVHNVDASGVQLWDWQVNSGELTRTNVWQHFNGFPLDGLRAGIANGKTNVHAEDIDKLRECMSALLEQKQSSCECTYRVDHDGRWLWLLDRAQVAELDDSGNVIRIQGALTDITNLAGSEERLNMLALSLTNISDGICIFDPYFKKREINKAFEEITGFYREQVIGQPLTFHAHDHEFIEQIKHSVFKDGSWRGELTDIRADGSEFQMELTLDAVKNDNGAIELIVASFSDVTERRETENELRRLSNTDSLTGLPNRSYFQVSHSNLVRKKVPHALLLFDLDDFKKINDSLGHEVGDQLLCRVAERLMDIGRRQDTLYRLGGDEFGLLIEDNTSINVISAFANQINQEISQPYQVEGHEVVVGSSIGIVLYPHDALTSQELLQKADTAMYHAKQRGGNCYQFFSQSMNENAIHRLRIENEVRNAIKHDRVRVMYQPKIEIINQHIAGIEALVRIERSDGSLLNPVDFIPLAEETGLIVPLSEQVLRIACRDMLRFLKQSGAPRNVAINLSARQFSSSSLALQIEAILAEEGLHPRHVEFEITEGMVMADPERAITMLENLAEMGVQLALDDFGTGYSSLAYLKRFPIHTLKVDKAFVDDISRDDKDRNMVASIIAMAHNLHLKVVAEGVESETQLEILKTLKCEYVQGFYYARPMSADDFVHYIESHQHSSILS